MRRAALHNIDFKFNVICLQECWLSDETDSISMQLPGYDCIAQGRTISASGGYYYLIRAKSLSILDLIQNKVTGFCDSTTQPSKVPLADVPTLRSKG